MAKGDKQDAALSRLAWGLLALSGLILAGVSYWSYSMGVELLLGPPASLSTGAPADPTSLDPLMRQLRDVHLVAALSLFAVAGALVWFTVHRVKSLLSAQERLLLERTNYDQLTGLANRALFMDRLEIANARASREGKLVAALRLNISDFEQVSTGLGHRIADQILVKIANRLREHIRACDTVARLGGDDFGIILGELMRKDEIESIVERILQTLHQPYQLDSQDLTINTRTGIAVYPIDQEDRESLLLSADLALSQAKKSATESFVFFTPEMGLQSTVRLQEEQSLRRALQHQEFCLHYQPKVDSTMGTIKGFEALIRWQHPQRGLVPPNEFIPVLEESGLILSVGEWVIRETCQAIRRWQDQGLAVVPVSVNVAPPQFNQDNFAATIASILDETGVEPGFLEVEITESSLMSDFESSERILRDLKSLGVSVAVDDFGTGYSSLSHLNRFPIDTLKIDRSFITNVHDRKSSDNSGIVTAIMALSHSLRLHVVAEGVETPQELGFLYALGCRTIQGFLFSQPLTESAVIELLKDSESINEVLLSVRKELTSSRASGQTRQ